MLHGWDWAKYPKFHPKHQWENRQELVDQLSLQYDVEYPSFPGFDDDLPSERSWTLDDYAKWVNTLVLSKQFHAIIGYSFGCAVALHWAHSYSATRTPLVLLSPAIVRAYQVRPATVLGAMAKAARSSIGLSGFADVMREVYLAHWVKNPNVIHGTPFLKRTYSNIVGENLAMELRRLLSEHAPILLVFGERDTATPPEVLFEQVPEARAVSRLISGGGHDIGTTHVPEIVTSVTAHLSEIRD